MTGEVFIQPPVLLRLRHVPQITASSPLLRGPIDPWLLLTAVLLLLVGEVMVFSTTYFYAFERFSRSLPFCLETSNRGTA